MRGLAWTRAIRWITQALSWTSTLLVAHLLCPDNYGIADVTMVFIALVQLVNEFGFGAAVASQRDRSEAQLAKLATFSLSLGAIFCFHGRTLLRPVCGTLPQAGKSPAASGF